MQITVKTDHNCASDIILMRHCLDNPTETPCVFILEPVFYKDNSFKFGFVVDWNCDFL